MGKLYGFFSYPAADVSYFAPTTLEVAKAPVTDDGGCLFTVTEPFIQRLEAVLNNPANEGGQVFVEISGDDTTIFTDQATDSVISFAVFPDTNQAEASRLSSKARRFKSCFFSRVLPFPSFKKNFQIRKLN